MRFKAHMKRHLGWTTSLLLTTSVLAAGQTGAVTTPTSASAAQSGYAGTAESVTGTEQAVSARIAVTTGKASDFTAKDHLQVTTKRPEPPAQAPAPQPVAAAREPEPAPVPAPEPAPAHSPALRHKELPRTDSPLPLMALAGMLLIGLSFLSRCLVISAPETR